MLRWARDWYTENDGETSCPVRVFFIMALLVYFSGTCYDALTAEHFEFLPHARDWATGMGTLLGLGGGGVACKSFTEKTDEE